MANAKRSKRARPASSARAERRGSGPHGGLPRPWSEFFGIALLAVSALMFGGLVSYHAGDGTLMGPVGQLIAASAYACFGMAAYLLALGVLGTGVRALLGRGMEISLGEGIGFSLATLCGCVLLHVMFPEYRVHGFTAGGLTGELMGEVALGLFHHAGTYLVAGALLTVGLIASTPLSVDHFIAVGVGVGRGTAAVGRYLWTGVADLIATQRDPGPTEASPFEPEPMAEDEGEDDWLATDLGSEDPDASDDGEADDEDDDAASDEDEDDDEEADDEALAGDEARSSLPAVGAGIDAQPRAKAGGNRRRKAKSAAAPQAKAEADKSGHKKVADPAEPEIVVGTPDDVGGAKTTSGAAEPSSAAPEPKAKTPPRSAEKKDAGIPGLIRLTSGPFELPHLELFEAEDRVQSDFDRGFVLDQAQKLVAALAEFRIRGKVTKIHPGPVITRYEFKPEAGVKLSKIESLENDIAMALEAIRIRILAPIPGKATVGFEVPNKSRETVYIKEILAQEDFGHGKKLPLALGKDITGHINSLDLTKAPHLLVAGATGSGKSVGVNAMICSLLYRCTPDEVRMIMIDPKMLELSIYEGIPHLLLPVVTDPEKAALALRWAVQEMERRYALLSTAQVRDIAGYNRKLPELMTQWEADRRAQELIAAEARAAVAEDGEEAVPGSQLGGVTVGSDGQVHEAFGGEALPDPPSKLPYVVVIIDEFADLMMVASKEVEQSVARIAAKARAAGVHLIVATQRPSVDVITGTIKNNFPSRIAFQVTSDADSRTILDGKGAKQLLGMGDMLHMDRGMQPKRVHGCFVSEDEILKVVQFVKRQAKPVYNMDIVRNDESGGDADADASLDPLYDRAVEIVAEAQKVSTSMLQRRLGVGYNRAAKIVESMEQRGVIGPARGTSPREVYVSAA